MILSAIILMGTAVITFLTGLLPRITSFPQAFQDAWEWITGLFANFVWVIPHGTDFLLVFNIGINILVAIFIWYSINWLINKLRGSGN